MEKAGNQRLNILFQLGIFSIFVAFLIPGNYLPFVSFLQEFCSFAGLAFLLLWLITSVKIELRVGTTALIVFLISIIPLIQYFLGIIFYFGDAFLATIYLFTFFLAILIGQNTSSGLCEKFVQILFFWLLVASLASSFIAMYQWLDLQGLGLWVVDVSPNRTPGANLSQRNLFATLVCMGFVALFYYKDRLDLGILVTLLGGAVLVCGLAICQSRTPWVIGFLSIAWVFFKTKNIAQKKSLLCWLFFVVSLYLFLSLWLLEALSNYLLLTKDTFIREAELGTRSVLWAQFSKAIIEGPWFGYGWQQVSLAQVSVAQFFPKTVYVTRSHNLFLDLMIWNGLLPGLMMTGVILCWAWRQVSQCSSNLHYFILWSIGCIAVHSMFEFPHEYAFFLIPLGIFVGMSERICCNHFFVLGFGRQVGSVLLLAVIVLMGILFNDNKVAKTQLVSSRYESAGILHAEKMLIPGGRIYLATQIKALLDFISFEAREDMTEAELQFMRQVSSRYPFPPSLFRYSLALGLNHQHKEAQRILLVLQKLHSESIYAEAVDNWAVMSQKYPQLLKVKPPEVNYSLIEDAH